MKVEAMATEKGRPFVFLHGAGYVDCFAAQEPLAQTHALYVPHLMGYGAEEGRVFEAGACLRELTAWIDSLGTPVVLVGFSLGAQLAFALTAAQPQLFRASVLISPWLIKEEPQLSHVERRNLKYLRAHRPKAPSHWSKAEARAWRERQEQTMHQSIYNGISIAETPAFTDCTVPMVALAGEKDFPIMHESIAQLAALNPHCHSEIWQGAAHNIPTAYAERLNALLASLWED